MQRILTEAAAVGNATARALAFSTRDPGAYYYANSAWKTLFIGNNYEFSPGGVLDPDARTCYFYFGTGSSPVWTVRMVGKSSQYAMAERDAARAHLDGADGHRSRTPPSCRSRLTTAARRPHGELPARRLAFHGTRRRHRGKSVPNRACHAGDNQGRRAPNPDSRHVRPTTARPNPDTRPPPNRPFFSRLRRLLLVSKTRCSCKAPALYPLSRRPMLRNRRSRTA
jgi:hypothetical protein